MAEQSDSDNRRLIKKYPNRRLYDTEQSRYITLSDVEKLVHEHVNFWVQDTKTGEDITRTILLQVISEREESDSPVLSQQVLEELVRMYGGGLQKMAQDYLDLSVGLWTETQEMFRKQASTPTPMDPVSSWQQLTQQNLEYLQRMQNSFFSAYQPRSGRKREDDD